jgi:beta-1,4-mannosyl-glycoprotein beta-1,4-N-acetylglucosaminyltransferase
MKIYDCFQFFNEFDLLEIRLEMLYDEVDHFVISETSRTHSDLPKPFNFNENKHRFEKYLDKIIHVMEDYPSDILHFDKITEDSPYNIQRNRISDIYDKEEHEGQLKRYPTFCRDYLQREFIKFGLLNCEDEDIILVSDLDEIPNPEKVKEIREKRLTNIVLMHNCYYYYVNLIAHTNWHGAYAVKYGDTKNVSLTHIRGLSGRDFKMVEDGGWHLSFMGGSERVKTKIMSYAHQEFNNPWVLNSIDSRISKNQDPFGRGNSTYNNPLQTFYYENMLKVSMDTYPDKMRKLIEEKFNYLIKK